jgi:polysaccharide deacetylase family sporulation protein PdaB
MKVLILRKRSVLLCAVLALLLTVLTAGAAAGGAHSAYFGISPRRIPVYRVATEEKKVALSFDAAWGSDKTEGIMGILKEYNAAATFFLVGFWVDNNRELTKKIAENGYEIGTHSNTHTHMSKLTREQATEDLKQSAEKIRECAGVEPKVFRPPFGEYDNKLIEAAEGLGLTTVQWDVDSLDWMDRSTEQIVGKVIDNAREGSIVLFHNNADHILDVLPIVMDRLKMRGYTFVSVSGLVYTENYTIDNTGEQKRKA